MNAKKRSADPAHDLCASVHDDDSDPRFDELDDRRELRDKPDRKTEQLCKQARIALEHALRARAGDPFLQDLTVERVDPAPNATRLRVTLTPPPGRAPPDERRLLTRLAGLRGALRAEVAAAITRKRVPELTFALAPASAEATGEHDDE